MGLPQNFVQMLMRGPKWLDAHLADMRSLGTVTEADAKKADKLTEAWARMRRVVEQLGRDIMSYITPTILSFMNTFTDTIKKINDSFPTIAEKAKPIFEFLGTLR